jgi:membrane associated rhomboid family serine protease
MIPISDANRSRSAPYVNYTLIGLNLLVFVYQLYLSGQTYVGPFTELDRFIWEWGNIPPCTFDALGWDQGYIATTRDCALQPRPALTPLTAMFMHVGWLHLLGNMLFLWIFGDNVEAAMGHVRYLGFYLLVGILAAFAHGMVNLDSTTPAVGASGAVAGVMGAYIVLYPRATVIALIPPLIFLPLPVPAFIVIGLWFVIELVRGFASLGPDVSSAGGGIAYFAHIGGFVAGILLVKLLTMGRRRYRTAP